MVKKMILFVMIVLIGGLACCARNADSQQPAGEKDEQIIITLAVWGIEESFVGDAVLDAVEEKFNVKFVPVDMSWDNSYQKVERWAATGSLPDLFAGDFRNSSLYPQWIEQGLLCAIPENLSDYPHLDRYMNELKKSQIISVDNQYYCIPRQTYPSQAWTSIDRVIAYRWDLAQAAGITKEPETWDEFQDMILAIIKEDPENKGIQGMTAENAGQISGLILPYASSIAVSGGNGFYWKKAGDGGYSPVYFTDNLTCAFQLARDMYTSGVIEKEVVMETTNSAREKFLRGESAAILYSGGFGGGYEAIGAYWEEYHGRDYAQDVKALKLMPDINGVKAYPVWGYAWSESYISAKVDAEKLDRILQIYDYLLSDEGAFFGTYGPEGDLYEVVDGKVQMYEEDTFVGGKYPSCRVFTILVRWLPSTYDDRFVSNIPEIYDKVNRELMQEAEAVPIPEYEPACTGIMKEEKIDFTINVEEDFLRIMTGTNPVEEMWQEIRNEYEEKGLQNVIDVVNKKMKEREN